MLVLGIETSCDETGIGIVRGTQLRDIIRRLFDLGAREVHMRPACPPLVFSCKFLNFSRSRSLLDLAARKAIAELEGDPNTAVQLVSKLIDEDKVDIVTGFLPEAEYR